MSPDAMTFNSVINACKISGQWRVALGVLREMQATETHPSVVTYNNVMSACAKGGQSERAVALLEEMMRGRGAVTPDVVSFSIVIETLEKGGRTSEADELYTRAMEGPYDAFGQLYRLGGRGDRHILDLHGTSEAVARVVLRVFLEEMRSGARQPLGVLVITGRGKHSQQRSAVLPDALRAFLSEVSGPTPTEVPGNPGVFKLTKTSIDSWCSRHAT